MAAGDLSTYLARFAKARGFGDVPFHGLRHGAATLPVAAEVRDPVAVTIMGHADTRILGRYQGAVPKLTLDASAWMHARLGEKR